MGIVYRAYDERLRRSLALKVLPDDIAADPRRRAQILDEARAASALTHPAITTVHEVGEDGDALFIVMELVVGRTLRELIAEGSKRIRSRASPRRSPTPLATRTRTASCTATSNLKT